MKIEPKDLFINEVNGRYVLGIDMGRHGTITLAVIQEDDYWLYPDDIGFNNVINVFKCDDNWQVNFYDLPENWRDIVTNDSGKDGKKSIHDVMIDITTDLQIGV